MFDEPRGILPPPNEIPVGVNMQVLLEGNDRFALFAHTFQVWSTGCSFWMSLMLSPAFAAQAPFPVDFRGHAPPGEEDCIAIVTVVFADGRHVSNRPGHDDPELLLTGGSGRRDWHTCQFSFGGVPPAPELAIEVDWPGGQLSCSAQVPTEALRAARTEVTTVTLPWNG